MPTLTATITPLGLTEMGEEYENMENLYIHKGLPFVRKT